MVAEAVGKGASTSGIAPNCVGCGATLPGFSAVRLARLELLKCPECGGWTGWPRPTSADQVSVHVSPDYFEHPYFESRRCITPALQRRCRRIMTDLCNALGVTSLRGERLLDIGCDTGAFLECAAQMFGVYPVGLDVAGRSVDQAREAGIEAYCTLIENAPDSLRGFGVITAIDVVEHVSDPRGFLTEIRARLRPGGVAYLETPNIYSAVYRLGRLLCHWTGARPVSIWERLFPIQHVQYFSQRGFALLVKGSGLELVKLDTRRLPWADVAVSPFLRSGVALLQQLDRLTRQQVLLCAMVRRPPGDA